MDEKDPAYSNKLISTPVLQAPAFRNPSLPPLTPYLVHTPFHSHSVQMLKSVPLLVRLFTWARDKSLGELRGLSSSCSRCKMQLAPALLTTLLLLSLVIQGQPQVQVDGGGITSREGDGSVLWTGFLHCSDSFQVPQVLRESKGGEGWVEGRWSTLPALMIPGYGWA